MSDTTKYDQRVVNLPPDWKKPVTQVLDTVETVAIALRAFNLPEDPTLISDLTLMILDRYDQGRFTELSRGEG